MVYDTFAVNADKRIAHFYKLCDLGCSLLVINRFDLKVEQWREEGYLA